MLKLTPKCVAYIASEEAVGLSAYLDSAGIWTWSIGIAESGGHKVRQYKDKPQSIDICLKAAIEMIEAQYLPVIAKALPNLEENQLAASLSFLWRNGQGNFRTAQWVKDFLDGKPTSAKADWAFWTNHGNESARCKREMALFFNDSWPANMRIRVFTAQGPHYLPVGGKMMDIMPALQQIMGGA